MTAGAAALPRRLRRRLLRSVFAPGVEAEDSYGYEALETDGLAHPDRVSYEVSGWRFLSRALAREQITPGDGFVDYGAGKGRVVHQAASYPFGRVIGLEISPRLARIAGRTVAHNRARFACPRVEIVCADVVDFVLPDDITYAYFYNPFIGDTFRIALAGLIESLDRRPRELTLLYSHPVMAAEVEASGRFEPVRRISGLRDDPLRTTVVYKSLPR